MFKKCDALHDNGKRCGSKLPMGTRRRQCRVFDGEGEVLGHVCATHRKQIDDNRRVELHNGWVILEERARKEACTPEEYAVKMLAAGYIPDPNIPNTWRRSR